MRILIDLQGAQTGSRFRGIGRYSLAFSKAIAANNGGHEVWLLLNANFAESVLEIQSQFRGLIPEGRIVIMHLPKRVSWESASNAWRRASSELIRQNLIEDLAPDIVYVTSLFEGGNLCHAVTASGSADSRYVTAISHYDLIPLLNADTYLDSSWARDWYFSKVEYLKKTDLLLAISDYAALEAKEALKLPEGTIVSVSSACTRAFYPRESKLSDAVCLQKLGIRQPFLLSNGVIEPRKNLEGLIRGFSLLPLEIKTRYHLVIAGSYNEAGRRKLRKLAEALNVTNQIILTGHVDDDELVTLFNTCELFVFPSLHEGFGLPALEAMACGAATIGSNVTSIPEVIGREDALFDPFDPADIAKKITGVLNDDSFKESLRDHALIQSAKFSWDQCAVRAIQAFEQALNRRNSHSTCCWKEVYREKKAESYARLVEKITHLDVTQSSPSDDDLKEVASCIAQNEAEIKKSVRIQTLPVKLNWRVEGPFDSSYSLAIVNREIARSLEAQGHTVALHSTEGPGDFDPDPLFLAENPDLENLFRRSKCMTQSTADVTSRNLYPPRVSDMICGLNFMHAYGWEESGFPAEWVDSFNESLQGLTVMSGHVRKVLIDAGVVVPIAVCGLGVDHWLRVDVNQSYKVEAEGFRFLHVSSCFPRKGVDILLKAFGKAFRRSDAVTLVIKTFPNPHNQIFRWLAEAKGNDSDYPSVQIIEKDLSDAEIKSLYEQCDALIAPSRAEGFGLPLAEAMLSGIPVVTTAWSGQLDFCDEHTSWLVDYQFEHAQTHFGVFDSYWAEPNEASLVAALRSVYEMPSEQKNLKTRFARESVLKKLKWGDVVTRMVEHARECVFARKTESPPKIGWVSTWNTRCGIAAYSANLIKYMPRPVTLFAPYAKAIENADDHTVTRCWTLGDEAPLDSLTTEISKASVDVLVIQFQYSFFGFESFENFLIEQLEHKKTIILVLHATSDAVLVPYKRLEMLSDVFKRCARIFVHSVADLNRLKAIGLVGNVGIFPHGVIPSQLSTIHDSKDVGPFRLGTFGFFLPHKGLLETIEAVSLLRSRGVDLRLRMLNAAYPAPESEALIGKARNLIRSLGLSDVIELRTDFISDDDSLELLSEANLLIFPYQNTGESSSAAVRQGIASGVPVAVTPLEIFDDVSKASHLLPGTSVVEIADGIAALMEMLRVQSPEILSVAKASKYWRKEHEYPKLAKRFFNISNALFSDSMVPKEPLHKSG